MTLGNLKANGWKQKKNHSEGSNPDTEMQAWCALTYKWIFTVKDNHATVHNPRKASKEGPRGEHMDLLGKRK